MMPDREKVLEYLENEIYRAEQSVNDIWLECVEVKLLRDALALLKEQEAVIRCKDCNNRGTSDCPIEELCNGWIPSDDWFCADGVAKDIDVLNK